MKNKFIVFILTITIISFNINDLYADYKDFNNSHSSIYYDYNSRFLPATISPIMLAVVSTLAVGTGLIIRNSEEIYNVGRLFYDYIDSRNDLAWSTVMATFNSSVMWNNGNVKVGQGFLNIVKDFLNFTALDNPLTTEVKNYSGIPILGKIDYKDFKYYEHLALPLYQGANIGSFGKAYFNEDGQITIGSKNTVSLPISLTNEYRVFLQGGSMAAFLDLYYKDSSGSWKLHGRVRMSHLYSTTGQLISVGVGSYDWDSNINDKLEQDGGISLPIPGDLGNLVGKNPSDIWDNKDNLVGTGGVSIPGVGEPSIGVEGDNVFPGTGVGTSCPECGLTGSHSTSCSKYKCIECGLVGTHAPDCSFSGTVDPPITGFWEWVTSLFVPTADYWQNNFNDIKLRLEGIFPIDLSLFEDLCINGKPLPDFTLPGTNIVFFKGSVINEFAPTARLLVQGAFSFFLVYFNYKRIMKIVNK